MKTTVETLDPVSVKLTVEVEPARVKKAFDAAAKDLAKQVSLPGFRPGKAPRRLLEQRLGSGAIAQQALENALSDYYVEALEAEQIAPVAQPEVDVTTFDEAEGCTFTATVEIRPDFDPPDHQGIDVTFPEWDVDDADVEAQLERLRERFAEVDEVERAAELGDYVTLDLRVWIDGEELESAHVEDALYEVGSKGVTPKLDDELVDRMAGDEFTYADVLPDEYPDHGGQEAEFRVVVRDVRAKTLPDLDDDFAATASEFDTIAELRTDVRDNLLRRSIEQARHRARGDVLEAYLAKIDLPLPPSMVDDEVDQRKHALEHQAEQYGMDLDDLFESQDTDEESWVADARTHATTAVKARLVLEALAERLDIQVAPDDVNDEIIRHAMNMGVDPDQVAQVIQQQGTIATLFGDIVRRKALDAIMAGAALDGAPSEQVQRELGLLPDEPDEPDEPAVDSPTTQPSGLIVPGQSAGTGEAGGLIVPGRD
jgi:trigger factor